MTLRRWRGAILALSLAATPVAVANGHVRLIRSAPAAGDTLAAAPAAIRLWFSGRAELAFTLVRLLGVNGREVPLGSVGRLQGSGSAFSVAVGRPLGPGTYTVEWQTAAADGHPVRGRFTFAVAGSPAAATGAAADTTPSMAERVAAMPDEDGDELADYEIARWAEFIAVLAVLGTVVFRFAIVGALERRREPVADLVERARQIGLGAAVLLLATGTYRLMTELRALSQPAGSLGADLGRLVIDTAWGRGWLVGGVGALLLLIGLALARRAPVGWLVATLGALAVAVSPALTGHAAADPRPALATVVDVLHVLGAGAWLGTLLLVVLAAVPAALQRVPGERGPAVASIVRAFHPIALACVPLVLVSGLVAAWLRLGSFAALFGSRYGTYLLIKIALFACVAATGAYNWRRVLPSLGDETGARTIRRTASLELALGALVLAVTAALVITTPP